MQDFLAAVRKGLQTAIATDAADPILTDIARYAAVESSGKLARPRLIHAFSRAVELSESDAEPIAVATELVHVASLLHDDIVDEAMLRRGRTAPNRMWGNAATVLGGDFVLCRALFQLADQPVLARRIVAVVEEMSSAAVAEVAARAAARAGNLFDAALSRRVSTGKTAALFGWCGWAPAARAGREAEAEAFEHFGRRLGIAFQYIDDIHDFAVAAGGDRPLADLRTRNPNLVIALACEFDETCAEKVRWLWVQEDLPDASVERVATAVCATPAIRHASIEADQALDDAMEAAAAFADRDGFDEVRTWIDWARHWKSEIEGLDEGGEHAIAG